MKILLFGKNGQVGWELQRSLAPLGEVIALDARSTEYCGDLTNLTGIQATVETLEPAIIVNAAAYTAVDHAQSEPSLAHTVNALAPNILAQAAQACGACFVHYSTDYVFDGSGELPWSESDPTGPLNVYGESKLAGELFITQQHTHYLIFRTSWVYAARGKNFAKTMIKLAQERPSLTVINDQFGAPTGSELLADVTAHALRMAMDRPKLSGIYHLAAAGETTWYDYARFVLTQAEHLGLPLKAKAENITPVPTSTFSTPAVRPHNSRLNTQKLCQTFNLTLPHWQLGVTRMLTETL